MTHTMRLGVVNIGVLWKLMLLTLEFDTFINDVLRLFLSIKVENIDGLVSIYCFDSMVEALYRLCHWMGRSRVIRSVLFNCVAKATSRFIVVTPRVFLPDLHAAHSSATAVLIGTLDLKVFFEKVWLHIVHTSFLVIRVIYIGNIILFHIYFTHLCTLARIIAGPYNRFLLN